MINNLKLFLPLFGILGLTSKACDFEYLKHDHLIFQTASKNNDDKSDFMITHLPDSYDHHQFFIANLKMSGFIFVYFTEFFKEQQIRISRKVFIKKFLYGDNLSNVSAHRWMPVVNKMEQELKQEAEKYRWEKVNFLDIIKRYIFYNWSRFKNIFLCKEYNPYGTFPKHLDLSIKYMEGRISGATWLIPILYGPSVNDPQLNKWQVGTTIRLTNNVVETKALIHYFYSEKIIKVAPQKIEYQICGPAIAVDVPHNAMVLPNLHILLKALQKEFNLTVDEIKTVAIDSRDYMKPILSQPIYEFHINFLNPLDMHQIYGQRTVRFYSKQAFNTCY